MKKDLAFVLSQIFLFVIYLFSPDEGGNIIPIYLKIFGLVLAIIGIFAILIALFQLNKHISPFPTPRPDSKLIDTGIFGMIRHPIYTGIFLVTLGYGLYVTSFFKMIISLFILIFFNFKAGYEEKLLAKHFHGYKDYIKRTGKFFPKW